jgi:acetolactate synthase-1/2/3 large subunit
LAWKIDLIPALASTRTNLVNTVFASFSCSFGAHAERDAESPAALAGALASGKAVVIELCTDPLQIGPQSHLAQA